MLAMNVHIDSPAFPFFLSSFIFDNKVTFFLYPFLLLSFSFSFSGIFQLFQLSKCLLFSLSLPLSCRYIDLFGYIQYRVGWVAFPSHFKVGSRFWRFSYFSSLLNVYAFLSDQSLQAVFTHGHQQNLCFSLQNSWLRHNGGSRSLGQSGGILSCQVGYIIPRSSCWNSSILFEKRFN